MGGGKRVQVGEAIAWANVARGTLDVRASAAGVHDPAVGQVGAEGEQRHVDVARVAHAHAETFAAAWA